MEPANLESLVEKVKAIAHGPHADLLESSLTCSMSANTSRNTFPRKTWPPLRQARRKLPGGSM